MLAFLHGWFDQHAAAGATRGRRALLLVPTNVVANWKAEFAQWLEPLGGGLGSRHHLFVPAGKGRKQVDEAIEAWHGAALGGGFGGVLLLSLGQYTARVSIKQTTPEGPRPGEDAAMADADPAASLAAPEAGSGGAAAEEAPAAAEEAPAAANALREMLLKGPDLVVVDEAHELRDSKSSRTRALKQLAAPVRIALTGTPLQNNLGEFWNMVDFVRPGFMDSLRAFRADFEVPIMAGRHSDASSDAKRKSIAKLSVLQDYMEPVVQRFGASARLHNSSLLCAFPPMRPLPTAPLFLLPPVGARRSFHCGPRRCAGSLRRCWRSVCRLSASTCCISAHLLCSTAYCRRAARHALLA